MKGILNLSERWEKMDNTWLTRKTACWLLFTINLRYETRQDLIINLIINTTQYKQSHDLISHWSFWSVQSSLCYFLYWFYSFQLHRCHNAQGSWVFFDSFNTRLGLLPLINVVVGESRDHLLEDWVCYSLSRLIIVGVLQTWLVLIGLFSWAPSHHLHSCTF